MVMRDSALAARADHLLRRVQQVVSTSSTAALMTTWLAAWQRESIGDRRRSLAVMLIVAVIVYVASVALTGEPQGWLWTIVPGAAVMVAGVLWMFASPVRSSD